MSRSPTDAASHGPSPGVKNLINFLLFVHLFSVAAMVVFNGSAMGLRQRLRRVPGIYLRVMGMDFEFDSGHRVNQQLESPVMEQALSAAADNLKQERWEEAKNSVNRAIELQQQSARDLSHRGLFHLTHADGLDMGHAFEFRYRRDGETHVVRLPERDTWPHQRLLRYQMLAREAARLTSAETARDILPAAVTVRLAKENQLPLDGRLSAVEPEVSIRRHTIQPREVTLERPENLETWQKDPWHDNWFRTVYARIPVVIDNEIRLNNITGNTRDFAPPVDAAPPPSGERASPP